MRQRELSTVQLKSDRDFFLEAAKYDPEAFEYASAALKSDLKKRKSDFA